MNWRARAAEYCAKLLGRPRMRKHYRCGQCHARRSLKRELWQYERPPKCRRCGTVDWRIDMARTREYLEGRGVFDTCYCDGLPHPHRTGSSVWCNAHPTGPTESDFIERYGR